MAPSGGTPKVFQLLGPLALPTLADGESWRDIGMLNTASQAHYDDAVRPGRRSAQAAPSALARRGAEEAASAEGCRIAVSVVSGEPDTEQWLTRLSTSQTDGVILVLTELSPAYRARLAGTQMPVVTWTRSASRTRGSRRSGRPTGRAA